MLLHRLFSLPYFEEQLAGHRNQWDGNQDKEKSRCLRLRQVTLNLVSKYYLVHGGLDANDEVLHQLSWINLEQKRPRWKTLSLQPRFNHRLVPIQPEIAKHFLVLFGGRNAQSEVVGSLLFLPLTSGEGELVVREPIEVKHPMRAREMPVVC